MTEMSVEEAKRKGAIGLFANKYGEQVKVYEIPGFSMEICGGPHAKNTGDLICFRILKEDVITSYSIHYTKLYDNHSFVLRIFYDSGLRKEHQ